MTDPELVAFLSAAAPLLGLRPEGYRRVRGTVRKRLTRRLAELGVDLRAYTALIEASPQERRWLDRCCRITISRFGRDAAVLERLGARVLPQLGAAALAAGRGRLRVWSAGCASGEEAYSIALVYRLRVAPALAGAPELEVLATDAEPAVLARAWRGGYPPGALRELPTALREAFEPRAGELFLAPEQRRGVRFEQADLRDPAPPGPFDLVLCRNSAFTYFAEPLQRRVADEIFRVLRPGGVLVVGDGEALPAGAPGFTAGPLGFYSRLPGSD